MLTILQYLAAINVTYAARGDVLVYIDMATQAHDSRTWGAVYNQAMAWYVAHLMLMSQVGATIGSTTSGGGTSTTTSGPVTSRRAGDLAETFGAGGTTVTTHSSTSVSNASLASTPFGLAYLALRDSRIATKPRFIGVVLTVEALAAIAYSAYVRGSGESLPRWEILEAPQVEGWCNAVLVLIQEIQAEDKVLDLEADDG